VSDVSIQHPLPSNAATHGWGIPTNAGALGRILRTRDYAATTPRAAWLTRVTGDRPGTFLALASGSETGVDLAPIVAASEIHWAKSGRRVASTVAALAPLEGFALTSPWNSNEWGAIPLDIVVSSAMRFVRE